MDGPQLLPIRVMQCSSAFRNLTKASGNSSYATKFPDEWIGDEFGRFKIWAGNIAAHRKGSSSLDYRLRDAPHLKERVLDLLRSLETSLSHCLAIVKGERKPWDELSDSDSDSDSESGHEFTEQDEGGTELEQLQSSIVDSITCLFRLSMSIRDPALQYKKTISIDCSYFESFDVKHAQEKFPDCDDYLAERLGRAISARRQHLTYREEHHERLCRGIERLDIDDGRTESTTNSTKATTIPTRTDVDVAGDSEPAIIDDCVSLTSYATSTNASLRTPVIPKESYDNEHYECPLCHRIISIHTTLAWKRHVYEDLYPYCCTFKDCNAQGRLFNSRREWFRHEIEAHRTEWECLQGCNQVFQTKVQFVEHFQRFHSDTLAQTGMDVIQRMAARSVSHDVRVNCPLCDDSMTLRKLQKHLGHHQEQLALFAIPTRLMRLDEDEKEDEDDDDMSNEGQIDSLNEDSAEEESRWPKSFEHDELIYIKDEFGRVKAFPFTMCQTWVETEELILETFGSDDMFKQPLKLGNYDLIDPNGDIIPVLAWERLVTAGWSITIRIRPSSRSLEDDSWTRAPKHDQDPLKVFNSRLRELKIQAGIVEGIDEVVPSPDTVEYHNRVGPFDRGPLSNDSDQDENEVFHFDDDTNMTPAQPILAELPADDSTRESALTRGYPILEQRSGRQDLDILDSNLQRSTGLSAKFHRGAADENASLGACFYTQKLFSCGDWAWGKVVKHGCRVGDFCYLKLVHDTERVQTPCELCEEIAAKNRKRKRMMESLAQLERANSFTYITHRAIVRALDRKIDELEHKRRERRQQIV